MPPRFQVPTSSSCALHVGATFHFPAKRLIEPQVPTSVGATDPGRNDPNSVALIVFIAFSEGDSTELAQLPGGGAPPPGFCVAAPQEWWRAPQANPAQAVVRGSRMTTRVSSTVPIAPVRVSFGCTGQLPSTSPISLANLSRGSYSPVPSTPGER